MAGAPSRAAQGDEGQPRAPQAGGRRGYRGLSRSRPYDVSSTRPLTGWWRPSVRNEELVVASRQPADEAVAVRLVGGDVPQRRLLHDPSPRVADLDGDRLPGAVTRVAYQVAEGDLRAAPGRGGPTCDGGRAPRVDQDRGRLRQLHVAGVVQGAVAEHVPAVAGVVGRRREGHRRPFAPDGVAVDAVLGAQKPEPPVSLAVRVTVTGVLRQSRSASFRVAGAAVSPATSKLLRIWRSPKARRDRRRRRSHR